MLFSKIVKCIPRIFYLSIPCALSCAPTAGDSGQVRARHQALRDGGTAVDPVRRAVIFVTASGPDFGNECAGTLIGQSLVLTAAHCLAHWIEGSFQCDDQGHVKDDGSGAGRLWGTAAPADVRIYAEPLDAEPLAMGVELIHPRLEEIGCSRDIAIIRLDRALEDLTRLPVRLERTTRVRSELVLVGFGKRNNFWSRPERNEVLASVRTVATLEGGDERPGTLTIEAGACDRDSGGPALDPNSGAVVGVMSTRLGDCLSEFSLAIATHVPDFSEMVLKAFELAGEEPLVEASGADCANDGASCEDARTPTAGDADDSFGDGGCAVGRAGSPRPMTWSAVLGLLVLLLRGRGEGRHSIRNSP